MLDEFQASMTSIDTSIDNLKREQSEHPVSTRQRRVLIGTQRCWVEEWFIGE